MDTNSPGGRRRFLTGLTTLAVTAAIGRPTFGASEASPPAPPAPAPADGPAFFPGFQPLEVEVADMHFRGVLGGAGPPVLLLHGYPETHITWRLVAPELARSYTVIIPDLPGYGDSDTRADTPRWTKRRVGDALVQLLAQLGHRQFSVIGHDRGARAAYRLALDHPQQVRALVALSVVPTLDALEAVDQDFAVHNFHWFLFAQPFDLPERLLASAPDQFITSALARMTAGVAPLEPAVLAAYRAAFRKSSARHAMCEDYRAALAEDAAADAADRAAGHQLACPVLVLYPAEMAKTGAATPVATWQRWAADVSGKALPGGHLLPEESPALVLAEVGPFLRRAHS